MTHKKSIYYINDSDLKDAGFDPNSITSMEFSAICKKVAEYFDVSFSEVLADAIKTTAENPTKL